jgi:hypothetical protein
MIHIKAVLFLEVLLNRKMSYPGTKSVLIHSIQSFFNTKISEKIREKISSFRQFDEQIKPFALFRGQKNETQP